MVTASGYALQPGITLPDDTQTISISTDGVVSVQLSGQSAPTIRTAWGVDANSGAAWNSIRHHEE